MRARAKTGYTRHKRAPKRSIDSRTVPGKIPGPSQAWCDLRPVYVWFLRRLCARRAYPMEVPRSAWSTLSHGTIGQTGIHSDSYSLTHATLGHTVRKHVQTSLCLRGSDLHRKKVQLRRWLGEETTMVTSLYCPAPWKTKSLYFAPPPTTESPGTAQARPSMGHGPN